MDKPESVDKQLNDLKKRRNQEEPSRCLETTPAGLRIFSTVDSNKRPLDGRVQSMQAISKRREELITWQEHQNSHPSVESAIKADKMDDKDQNMLRMAVKACCQPTNNGRVSPDFSQDESDGISEAASETISKLRIT